MALTTLASNLDGALASLIFLAVLGALGAQIGGSNVWIGVARVSFWGAVAMATTAGVSALSAP